MLSLMDIKCCVMMVPMIFKGRQDIDDSYRMAYVISHYDELVNTLPIEDVMRISDMVVEEQQLEADEAEELLARAEKVNRAEKAVRGPKRGKRDIRKMLKQVLSVTTNNETVETGILVEAVDDTSFSLLDDYGVNYKCVYLEKNNKLYCMVKHTTDISNIDIQDTKVFSDLYDEFNCKSSARQYDIQNEFIIEAHKRLINTSHNGVMSMLLGCIE